MTLSTRLTLALAAVALLLFGAVGAWQVRIEEAELRAAAARELRLLGRSLQIAFDNALRDRQEEDVEATLRALDRIDPNVDVFVYDRDGTRIAGSTDARDPVASSVVSAAGDVQFVPPVDPRFVEIALPLASRARASRLVVVRPLDAMRADLTATRRRVAASTAGFVVLVAMLTMALARFWVGRPLQRMNERMRRVRAGDLSSSDVPERGDEVGATLREFESLVRDLAEARAKLETEAEARRRLEDGLRHVDKLTTIGQLAANLAHEIGSPLQIIEGRLAGLEAKADDPKEARRLAGILHAQAQRITRIVARFSGLARRTAEPQVVDVGPSVRAVVDLMEGEARRRSVTLTLEEAAPLPTIEGHPDAIQQITLNLVRNALDATRAGGEVKVSLGRARVEGPDTRAQHVVRLRVTDDGVGMDEATVARVFEPFFTTRAGEGGSGLGLAVVKGIVDEHRGRVRVRSTLGEGSTFEVDFLASGPAVEAKQEEP